MNFQSKYLIEKQEDGVNSGQEIIEEVVKFQYFFSINSKTGGTDEEIKGHKMSLKKARHHLRC